MFPQDIQAVNMTLKSNCTKSQGNNLVEAGENMSNQGGNKSSRVILVVGGYGLYDTGAAFRLYLLYRCCTRVLSSNPDLRTLKWGFLTFYRVLEENELYFHLTFASVSCADPTARSNDCFKLNNQTVING